MGIFVHIIDILLAPLLVAAVGWMLWHFAARDVQWHVKFATYYAWLVSMSIIVLVPLDVWTALKKDDPKAISTLWSITYWSTQFLTWFIIPVTQGYIDSGGFTTGARLKSSIRSNLVLYCIMGVLGVVGVVFLIATGKINWRNLQGYAIACSNTFGLVVGVFLLAFGLVEVPRGMWQKSRVSTQLLYKQHRVARVSEKLDNAQKELSTVVMIVRATSNQMPRRSILRPYMDIIDHEADKIMQNLGDEFKVINTRNISENDMDYDTDVKSLAKLRRRLRRANTVFLRSSGQYKQLVLSAFELEDIVANAIGDMGGDMRFKSTIRPSRTGLLAGVGDFLEWLWKCVLHFWVYRGLALAFALVSMSVIVAEATIATHGDPDLSVISILVHGSKGSEAAVQLLVCAPLVYICACAYYSLFKLGAFSFYFLLPKHTDGYSLLISSSLMCRFAAPLAYNYLNAIHMDIKSGYNTVFTRRMGAMEDIPFFGTYLNTYFPIAIVLFCACVALNVFNRMASMFLQSARFRFDEDYSDAYIDQGRAILQRERDNYVASTGIWSESNVPIRRMPSSGSDLESAQGAPMQPAKPTKTNGDGFYAGLRSASNSGRDLVAMAATAKHTDVGADQSRWEDMKSRLSSKVAEASAARGKPKSSGVTPSTSQSSLDSIFSSLKSKRIDDDEGDDYTLLRR